MVSAGADQGQGLEGWRRLITEYDTRIAARFSGTLLALRRFDFQGGDLLQRLESLERAVVEHERLSGAIVSDNIRNGIVMLGLPEGDLKNHLVLHSERLNTWDRLKAELSTVLRVRGATAQSAAVAQG